MTLEHGKLLTKRKTSGTPVPDPSTNAGAGKARDVDGAGKKWSKRYGWATCREPYKTELDTLGSHWIEGELSNEALAFEAVQLLSELEWASKPAGNLPEQRLDDVIGQMKVLTEAMLAVSLMPRSTPADRRAALDATRRDLGGEDGPGR